MGQKVCAACSIAKVRAYQAQYAPVVRKRVAELRAQAFAVLGGPFCKRCGFSDPRALQIDHIRGGGGAHRQKQGVTGAGLYRRIIRYGGGGFQVLCANCNWIKRAEMAELQSTVAEAPWTEAQVESLRGFQASPLHHPFTAPRGRGQRGEEIRLIPTLSGWVVQENGPVVQTWAHAYMLDGSWRTPAT